MNQENKMAETTQMNVDAQPQEQGVVMAQTPNAEGGVDQQASTEASSVQQENVPQKEETETMSDIEYLTNKFQENNINPDGVPLSENEGIKRFWIYGYLQLINSGYNFGLLAINRHVKSAPLAKKKKSIKKAHGVIVPILVQTAKKCLDEGLGIRLVSGEEVTENTPNLDHILVIIDGQHRHQSMEEILHETVKDIKKAVEKGEEEDVKELLNGFPHSYYTLPLSDQPIHTILRECNDATKPWGGTDFLVSVLLGIDPVKKGVDFKMLNWVASTTTDCGDTATWLWATLDKSRIYSKAYITKAAEDDKKLKELAATTDFENGKAIYNAAKASLSIDVVKLKCVPGWVIDLIKKETENQGKKQVCENIVKFFESKDVMDAKDMFRAFKSDTDKDKVAVKRTKDQKIEDKLTELWEQYKNGK